MDNRLISIWIVGLLVIGGFVGFITFESEVVSAGTLYVGGIGPGNYTRIQWAIENASDGDTVFVYSGTYYEHIVVDKTINLIGENKNTTIIDGGGSGDVVIISANWVNTSELKITNGGDGIELVLVSNCKISNCNVSNMMDLGIGLGSSTSNTIANNSISDNYDGIILTSSSWNTVVNNSLSNNNRGIYIRFEFGWPTSPDNNTIIGNNVSDNTDGIYIESSSNNTIINNNVSSNTEYGIWLESSSNNNITKNKVLNNWDYGIHLESSNGNNVTNNALYINVEGGVSLISSDGNNIVDNDASRNDDYIIYLESSNGNNIIGNNASYGDGGIHLLYSDGNNIIGNNVSSNTDEGIRVYSSNNNTINGNNASSNDNRGISFYYSNNNNISGNDVFYNDFIGISLKETRGNNIIGNTMILDGIYVSGDLFEHWNTHTIDTSNTVNGKPVYYWKNQTGGTIPPGAGQVILSNCTGVTIENQELNFGSGGIEIGFSNGTNIIGNNASSNDYFGMYFRNSSKNSIIDNHASNNYIGVGLHYSDRNIILNNNASFNDEDDFSIYYSNENNITGNIASNCEDGIELDYSDRNNISGNIIFSNEDDILSLYYSDGNNITGNIVFLNTYEGITLWSSNNNTITGNEVSNNSMGIYLSSSTNNTIYHNNIIDNTLQAFDNTNNGNQWDNGYPSGGNYWSDFDEPSEGAYDDYQGPNQDQDGSDGIVDNGTGAGGGKNPYMIDADSIDHYPLTTPISIVLPDSVPPTITNLQPPDTSTTNDSTPIISANYSDDSEIDVSRVVLRVDDMDVTSSATVTSSGITYTPTSALSDGIYNGSLEVRDTVGNLATASWSFTIDATPPTITNLQPSDTSTTNDNTSTISADYSDSSGINVSSVLLEVDGVDVTSFATITASNIAYIPGMALLDEVHTIYLEVEDIHGNPKNATWSFTVDTSIPDTTPPTADAGADREVQQGDTVIFNGSESTDDSGTIANYTWTFTYNGTTITLYGVNQSFKFENVGNYEVTLTVKDLSNNSATDIMWVNVTSVDGGNGEAEPEEEDFFWVSLWILLILIAVIVIIAVLLAKRKKGKPEELEPVTPDQYAEPQVKQPAQPQIPPPPP